MTSITIVPQPSALDNHQYSQQSETKSNLKVVYHDEDEDNEGPKNEEGSQSPKSQTRLLFTETTESAQM